VTTTNNCCSKFAISPTVFAGGGATVEVVVDVVVVMGVDPSSAVALVSTTKKITAMARSRSANNQPESPRIDSLSRRCVLVDRAIEPSFE
jgi:proline racemase